MRHAAALLLLTLPLAAAAAAPDAKALFLENCVKCHGENGDADTELGARYMAQDFTDPDFKKEVNLAKARNAVTNGVKKTKMEAWKGKLSPAEIDALARYVLSFPAKKK